MNVIENDKAIGLIETAGQGIVFRVGRQHREGPPGEEFQSRCIEWDNDADGVGFIAGTQRMNAADLEIIREYGTGGKLLAAFKDYAGIGLFDNASVQRWIALLMRRFAAVDLWRHDRVHDVFVIVADVFVEVHHVFRIARAAACKEFGLCGIAGEEAGDMVGRGIKSVAYIGFTDAYGEGWWNEFSKAAQANNLQIVANELHISPRAQARRSGNSKRLWAIAWNVICPP